MTHLADIPRSGTITLSWSEVSAADTDPLARFAWDLESEQRLGVNVIEAVLAFAAEHADELVHVEHD